MKVWVFWLNMGMTGYLNSIVHSVFKDEKKAKKFIDKYIREHPTLAHNAKLEEITIDE